MQQELAKKKEKRESGRALVTIPEERRGKEEAKDSKLDKKEDISGYLKAWEDVLFTQEA